MDNIISLSIIIFVIGFVIYMFISNREKFTQHHCNHILVANDVKGKICIGDVFEPTPTISVTSSTATPTEPPDTDDDDADGVSVDARVIDSR
jgi:hypothetical protein